MDTEPVSLDDLREKIRRFSAERDWEQFHSPKNLVMALSVEVSELVEHFQWLKENESERSDLSAATIAEVEEEVGDVFNYLLQLCDRLDIDPVAACSRKLTKNAAKYPVA